MADRGDTHYRVKNLNLWFAFSSLVMLVAVVWMMWDDFDAPWKKYQWRFREIEIERTEAQIAAMAEAQAREQEIQTQLDAARQEFQAQASEYDAALDQLHELKGRAWITDQDLKKQKSQNNWDKYIEDEELIHGAAMTEAQANLSPGFAQQFELEKQLEEDRAAVARLEAEIAEMTSGVDALEGQLKEATKDLDLRRKKLDNLRPEGAKAVASIVRDRVPGLDFIGPQIQVRKVVLPEVKLDLNFTKKPRIDMCMTCHMGIDKPGFEDQEQPYRSHPRLDLYLDAFSPHPMTEVGCTSCHRGSGEALDFQRADHRPSDPEEDAAWYEEYHWHKQHHWDYPMLAQQHTEAGCVQCHTTSMDLIADEAPTLSKGYRLFEESGCYSCHKVEWFPTQRKRGPELKRLAAKLQPDWVSAWVAKPKDFRPTTRMPQIFHLENYEAEDFIVKSEYEQGRDMYGDEWSDAAVASVTAYLFDQASQLDLPAIPVDGDATSGREAFRLVGCLACHNVAPYEPDDYTTDLAMVPDPENSMGPNLRGVATKLTPEWLYSWLKDPTQYWAGTRMPDLRLSDQEAADITAYIMEDPDGIFTDVPADWQPVLSEYKRDVVEEQARWFFAREGRVELQRLFQEDWGDDQALLAAVGEKWVMNQGCFSCHEINGMEDAMPIGVELTKWGSKTVDKLDFGFLPHILAEEQGWDHHEETQFKKYREGWLWNKLNNPRIYDRQKVKNPTERLRMPYFGFEPDEIEALTTFVVGLVNDDVHGAAMTPTPEQTALDAGKRSVRQRNCAACHVIDPARISFTSDEGEELSVFGEILVMEDYGEALPPPLEDFESYLSELETIIQEDEEDPEFRIEELIVRLLEPEPGVGDVGDTVIADLTAGDVTVEPGEGGRFVRVVTDYYVYGMWDDEDNWLGPGPEATVGDVDGEFREYGEEPYDKIRWTFAPPALWDEGGKLQRDWFYAFLEDPMPLREQLRVRMPSFHWDAGEAGHVADYFAYKSAREWPVRYARNLRHRLGLTLEEVGAASGMKAQTWSKIEAGSRPHIRAQLPNLIAFGTEQGFAPRPSIDPSQPQPDAAEEGSEYLTSYSPAPVVDPANDRVRRRDSSYLAMLEAEDPNWHQTAENLAAKGPNCFECHIWNGKLPEGQPIKWAPDLGRVRERLREDWVHPWLKNPALVYPGTAMPANFSNDPPSYQEFISDSGNEDQIQIIMDWLFNMDRAAFRN